MYRTRAYPFSGTNYREIHKRARDFFNAQSQKTRRRPYIRSAYFNKEKIFIDTFWRHLGEKNWRDRVRRMKVLPCGFELVEQSHDVPTLKINPNNTNEILYRFSGCTPENVIFYVQIKQNRKNQKVLLSVFPETKKTSR